MNFPIQMTARPEPARSLRWVSPAVALLLTVITGAVLFALLGQDPLVALRTFFVEPLATVRGWTEIAVKMTPLLLCSVGLVVCFRANVWNIGAEGQLIAGAIAGGAVALCADSTPGPVSLMLVYVAQLLLAWAVQGPMRDPQGFGFPQTRLFDSGALLPVLIEGTRLHAGALLALISAFGIWILMDKMALGFQFKISGMAPLAARYAGYRPGHLIWASMLISGALAGLAGGIEATALRPSSWPSSDALRRLAAFPRPSSWRSFTSGANSRRAVWVCPPRSRASIRACFSSSSSRATR